MIRRRVGFEIPRWLWLASVAAALGAAVASAQVPIPVQEQVQLFNSLPPAQQQSLIRELQRQLPPAQREAVLNMLQGGRGAPAAPQTIDPASAAILDDALSSELGLDGDEVEDPRFGPRDTLVLQFEPRQELLAVQNPFFERLANSNPYELDAAGTLYLPGVPPIELAGLNVAEATVRVQAEPLLRPYTVTITYLPLTRAPRVEPFGYDLFERVPSTFAPVTDIPVPVDYVIGPGDTVNVQLFDAQNAEYFLTVSREGTINFPEIGPINVSGLSFAEMRDTINERVAQQMIGVRASVTLGELRSIRVFVLGDAVRPGSYTVSSLATMTNALFASGGVKPIGSLRNIALRRDGTTVGTLDLYDLLLSGDTRGDLRLQPGDAIFVPPVGPRVTVEGEVRRPAIYELRNEPSVAAVVALAGGLNAEANSAAITLQRVVPNRGVSVQDISLSGAGAQTIVRDGDVLQVPINLELLESTVELAGNVYQPGRRQWFEGMRLADLIRGPEVVKPLTDVNYALIRRELAPNVDIEVLSANLEGAWSNRQGPDNVPLRARDTVYVFNIDTGREHIVAPIIDELEAQAAPQTPIPVVRVGGQVRAPGAYPLEPGMRLSDLLRAGGGLSEAAYATNAELTRYVIVNGEYRETELVTVDLLAVLRGEATADVVVSPYDYLNVKEVPRWRDEEYATIRGEVMFPGQYPIRRGEMLSSLLARAGGLTDLAFPEGSVFMRVALAQREREELSVLASRLERELAVMTTSTVSDAEALGTGQSLLAQIRNAQPTGRFVIRVDALVNGDANADVALQNGDQLLIPDRQQSVMVLGEVQYPTSHLFDARLSRDEYIDLSGGLAQRADEKRIYVVRANGAVVADPNGSWFRRDARADIRAGDAIVVPLDLDDPLGRWASITQIVYNLAVAVAAVNSF
jgi:protein involved in polysaccharide export with SLBB domain